MPVEVLAGKLKLAVDRVLEWEEGTSLPTFKQAEKVAKHLHVPFGLLFLDQPPADELPIPDLRTTYDAPRDGFSADFMDLLADVQFQHDWFKEFLVAEGHDELEFVGSFSQNNDPMEIAADIRRRLRIDPGRAQQAGGWEQHLDSLFERCEDIGVWVMRSGYVGNNTRRTFLVSEFRGFAIADKVIPLVFINGRDAKAAQAFTLAHELAHIWLGESGISDNRLYQQHQEELEIEALCNRVAAEVLVPAERVPDWWRRNSELEENIGRLASVFKVSRVVAARRAVDLGYISWARYSEFFEAEKAEWDDIDGAGSGGNFYYNAPIKNGRRYTKAVLSAAMGGNLLLRDAGSLLNMKPNTVKKLYLHQVGAP